MHCGPPNQNRWVMAHPAVPQRHKYNYLNSNAAIVYICVMYIIQDIIQPVAEVTSRRRLRSASSSALVVPATRRSSLGDRAFAVARRDRVHGTVYLSSSLTARHFSPSRNISRLIYLVYLFIARFDCVKRPCSSLGCLRRYNFVKLHYITLCRVAGNTV